MTLSAEQTAELHELLWRLRAGTAELTELARLEEMVCRDSAVRKFYVSYMHLCADLFWHNARKGESRESRVESENISGQWPVVSGQGGARGEGRGAWDAEYPESPVLSGQWPVASGQKLENQKSEIINQKYPTPHAPRPTPLASTLHSWAVSYAVATLLLSIALLGAWFSTITHPDADSLLVDANSRRVTPSGDATKDTPQFTFVGRVSGMIDCQFAESSTSTVAGAAVSLNRRYALKSGLMEIAYDSGAKVILQGPCDYTVESRSSGFLQVGKLVAKVESRESRVESKAESGKQKAEYSRLSTLNSRLFAVRTPTATVEDLGTEFGVEVSESGETSSHVFAGRVVMRTEGAGDGGRGTGDETHKSEIQHPTSEILLSAGQSARVEKDAKTGEVKLLSGKKNDSSAQAKHKFVRRLRKLPKELDLLDIVAGGNGTGNRREHGVDPTNGREATSFQTMMYPGDEQYKRVEWNRLIDGVFVPVRHQRHVQLDSAGHTFDEFGFGPGGTGCPVWARAADVSPVNQRVFPSSWAYSIGSAEQFMPKRRGLLCLHSSTGITFDLEAMRRLHAGARPARFKAVAGLADARRLYPDAYGMADLWVFVDGQLLHSTKKLRPEDGTVSIDVLIAADARFLTLVTTDAHNGASYDWLVFGDPVLEMLPDDATQAQEERPMEH